MDICRTLQEDCPAGLVRYGDMNECGFSLAKASRDAKAGMEDFLISTRQFLATVETETVRFCRWILRIASGIPALFAEGRATTCT